MAPAPALRGGRGRRLRGRRASGRRSTHGHDPMGDAHIPCDEFVDSSWTTMNGVRVGGGLRAWAGHVVMQQGGGAVYIMSRALLQKSQV